MDKSLFSAMRIVAVMIGTDGVSELREIRWFLSLMRQYGATKEQRKILREDIERQPDVEEFFREIRNPDDRDQLIVWLRKMVAQDGDVHPAEKALLSRIEKMHFDGDQQILIRDLLEHERNMRMWEALNAAGQMFRKRTNPWQRNIFSAGNWHKIGLHRGVYWGVTLVFFFLGFIKVFFKFLYRP